MKRVTVAFLAERVIALESEVARLRELVEAEDAPTEVIGFRVEQDPDEDEVADRARSRRARR